MNSEFDERNSTNTDSYISDSTESFNADYTYRYVNPDPRLTSDFSGGRRPGRKQRKNMSDAGCFVTLFVALLAVAIIIGVWIYFSGNGSGEGAHTPTPQLTPNTTDGGTEPETDAPIATYPPATNNEKAVYDGVPPTINDTANPFPDICDGVKQSVLGVCNYAKKTVLFNDSYELQSSGSGFVVTSSGYVLTNAHVIEDADKVTVLLPDETELEARVIGYDNTTDVAVLKFDNTHYYVPALSLADSDTVRVGEFVLAIGDPSGRELAGTTTFGIVSAINRSVNITGHTSQYLQTDAAMNPGNSGGPLINAKGQVIGINSAKTVTASYDEDGNTISAEGLGFAIPINQAIKIADQLIDAGHIERPGIGISVSVATPEILNDAGLEFGLSIFSVVENGPADKAGLKANDIIISCERTDTKTTADLTSVLSQFKVGDTVSIGYYRNGKLDYAVVTIGDLNLIG